MRSPVFVVGMPRSGTTLLGAMLNAHSQVAVAPETHFYTRCRADPPEDDTIEDVWARLSQQPGVQDMELTEEEKTRICTRIRRIDGPTPADLLNALGTVYAERTGAAVWGENTPDHLAHVPVVLREFPEAGVLCVVRDPRDVCLSLRSVPWNRDSLPEAAWKWRRYAEMSSVYRSSLPNRFREVRYEELLRQPESVLRSILEWLGLSFERRVLEFHRDDEGPADPDREPWKAKTRRPLDPTNTEKWRTRMKEAERAVVENVVGKALRARGYARPPIEVDAVFGWDLVRVLLRAASTIGHRLWRRWWTPDRPPGDHTPTWVRQREASSESEEKL